MAQGRKARAIIGALVFVLNGFWTGSSALATGEGEASLPLPRFASLHSDKVNLRRGPGQRYPVDWVFVRKDLPVEIIAQFEHWRRIRDWEGTEGWVQEHMLTGKREVMIRGEVRALRRNPDLGAPLVARAEPGVMARLVECQGAWCRIESTDVAGWVQRSDIWGVYPNEAYP
jgi:SH3-like domain-containing protein